MEDVDLATVARLIGEPTRAQLLTVMLDGRAYTTTELAHLAGISAATASEHLGRLGAGAIVEQVAQGRHRYHRLASHEVALALEQLAVISPPLPTRTLRESSAATALRPARLCYDHVAGRLGVLIHDHLVAIDGVIVTTDGITLTPAGSEWFRDAGIDVDSLPVSRRPRVRHCLDWTERRFHLAGSAPAALASSMIARRWLARRRAGERGLVVTEEGRQALAALLRTDPLTMAS